jgi:hypothetical protein
MLSFDMSWTRSLLEQIGLVQPPLLASDFLKATAPPTEERLAEPMAS